MRSQYLEIPVRVKEIPTIVVVTSYRNCCCCTEDDQSKSEQCKQP